MSICRNRWSAYRDGGARFRHEIKMLEQQVGPREPVGQPFHDHSHMSPFAHQTTSADTRPSHPRAVTFTPAVTKQVSAFLLSRSPALSPDSKSLSSLSAV